MVIQVLNSKLGITCNIIPVSIFTRAEERNKPTYLLTKWTGENDSPNSQWWTEGHAFKYISIYEFEFTQCLALRDWWRTRPIIAQSKR